MFQILPCKADSPEPNIVIMRVLLVSVVLPWMFGPYADQLSMVGRSLQERRHKIFWFAMSYSLPARMYTAEQIANAANVPSKPTKGVHRQFARNVTFLGLPRITSHFLVSQLKQLMDVYDIDALISLMDLDKLHNDVEGGLEVPSIAWYPNHFAALSEQDVSVLSSFTHVAALSPSDEALIRGTLPKHVIKWIPHAIQLPDRLRTRVDRAALRNKLGVPDDAFLVVVNCGNYETHNRKSLDTSLLAFQALRKTHPHAYLYFRAISVTEILMQERTADSFAKLQGPELSLKHLFEAIKLPSASYHIDTKIHSYSHSLEVMAMADVLLHP